MRILERLDQLAALGDRIGYSPEEDAAHELAEPAGRELVGGVLLGRVADPVAERGQLVESVEDPHARNLSCAAQCPASGRSSHAPASGNTEASANAAGHEVPDTIAANATGAAMPIAESTVC